jgi:drug/metabolite transporter (DMT)-like permease
VLAVFLALAAALSFGGSDFVAGVAARRAGLVVSVTLTAEAVKAILVMIVVPLISSQLPSGWSLAWGAVAGVSGGIGEMALYAGLRRGAFNVASSLSAVASAVFTVGAGLLLGERPGVLSVVGIALAIPAIAGVSLNRQPKVGTEDNGRSRGHPDWPRAPILLGLLAGAGFGLSLTALNRAGSRTDLWPLTVAELAAVATIAGVAAKSGELRLPPPGTRGLALLTGVLGTTGLFCFYLATHRGLLAMTAVIYSLFPAVTILLARILQGERLTAIRIAGLGLAAGSVVLMAAGGAAPPSSAMKSQ